MTNTSAALLLTELELTIGEKTDIQGGAMPGDQWLLASTLQKAIRRGEADIALRAASSLWHLDRQRFWRRLFIIALEDCGVSDPAMLVKVLIATAATSWRKKVGDLRVGLHLTQLLCKTVKTRLADSLFIQAERSARFADVRDSLATASDDYLFGCVLDFNAPLVDRALAIWFLAGTKKYPSDVLPLRQGSPDKAVTALRRLDVPPELTEASIAVMSRAPWPLSIQAPLLWQFFEAQRPRLDFVKDDIAPSAHVEGIPLYSMDMFTRTGQASFRQWQKAIPILKRFSVRQIGLAVFYTEGYRIDRTLTNSVLDDFLKAGEWADTEASGLCQPEYLGLLDCVKQYMPMLTEIREAQLRRYLEGTI